MSPEAGQAVTERQEFPEKSWIRVDRHRRDADERDRGGRSGEISPNTLWYQLHVC
jgi:hypothetical protein